MRRTYLILAASLIPATVLADAACTQALHTPPAGLAGSAVNGSNWLDPGTLRYGLGQAPRFMRGIALTPPAGAPARTPARQPIDPDRRTATDPADGAQRSLRHLLENRIDADGVLMLQHGQVLLDYRRSGFDPARPQLLLEATRPLLVTMLAKASAEGRFARGKAIPRLIPELAPSRELAKLSMQRLLDGRTGLQWSDAEFRQWQKEGGWMPAGGVGGVRPWLVRRSAWPRVSGDPGSDMRGPEGALLLWATEKAWKKPAPDVLCELLAISRARNPAFWATDPAGTPLADGLALSLEDFAAVGQSLLDARTPSGRRTIAPRWFADTLASPGNPAQPTPDAIRALGPDTTWQYRFAHPGKGHRAAIIGAYGSSLYVDFDHGTVVAVFASHAQRHSPLLMASLRSLWDAAIRQKD